MAVEFKRQAYSDKRIEKRNPPPKLFAKRYSLNVGPRGFSLIELMVVTGIVVVITSVVLTNNNRYGGSVLLQNLAYDIALSIRQAQVYGISVRGFGANNFSVGYGMHFEKNVNNNKNYVLFADLENTGIFNPSHDPTENVSPSPYQIGRGYYIADLCAPAGTKLASNSYSCTSVSQLDIVFTRPEPDAAIRIPGNSALQDSARILVESPRGDVLSIVVDATGQISVQ